MSGKLTHSQRQATEGLPKQFVTSLRVLFDILDEDRTGYVRLRDIESRWHEEGVQGLPSGVIETLKKVAPRNGRLTFDNFVTGLKLALLKKGGASSSSSSQPVPWENRAPPASTVFTQQVSKSNGSQKQHIKPTEKNSGNYANMANYMNIDQATTAVTQSSNYSAQRNQPKMGSQMVGPSSNTAPAVNTATVRPNNVLQSKNIELRNQIFTRDQMQQATVKLQSQTKGDYPQYPTDSERSRSNRTQAFSQGHNHKPSNDTATFYRKTDPKPSHIESQRPKSAHFEKRRSREVWESDIVHTRPERPPPYRKPFEDQPPALPPKNMQGKIMKELKTWHKEHRSNTPVPKGDKRSMHTTSSDSKLSEKGRLHNYDLYVNIEEIRKHEASQKSGLPGGQGGGGKKVRRQNSHRRHTLSSGIDYNVIRRMKQLETEKDVLLQGLEVVDRAREWYLTQIAQVAEKQSYADKTSCSEVTLQSQQERMEFVRSRIQDVNLNLKSLMETSESGFPAHMNLAVRSYAVTDDKTTRWLKDQNKQLTKEVGDKCEKISQLEKEKASLIRDLFDARAKHKPGGYDDTTFM